MTRGRFSTCHGGGYNMGIRAVDFEYRLAPENPYPASEFCYGHGVPTDVENVSLIRRGGAREPDARR